MEFNALRAVGLLYGDVGTDEPAFLGSCFALRDSTAVLTAAHCLGDLGPERLHVRFPHISIFPAVGDTKPPPGIAVVEVVRHAEADAALLRLAIVEWVIEPFWRALPVLGL